MPNFNWAPLGAGRKGRTGSSFLAGWSGIGGEGKGWVVQRLKARACGLGACFRSGPRGGKERGVVRELGTGFIQRRVRGYERKRNFGAEMVG